MSTCMQGRSSVAISVLESLHRMLAAESRSVSECERAKEQSNQF